MASIKPSLDFKRDLVEFGANTFNQCFQCATCSTVCPLSPEKDPFPRKEMLWLQWGLKDRLIRDPDIWLCHYCGQCSQHCPRGANPGETMMALRRCAITRYDWTGISRRLYRSVWWEVGAVAAVGLLVVALFALSGAFTPARMVTTRVAMGTFIPVHWVHISDWVLASLLTFFLLTNSLHMARLMLDGSKPPWSVYVRQLKVLLAQALVQAKWRNCEKPNRWRKHFILVTGYVTMFVLVMFFLPWLQVNGPRFTLLSWLGYYAAFAILYYSGDAMISRWRKREEMHRFSHASDWMFLILLFLTALTGILVNAFRLLDVALPAYLTYVIHLAIAVPMLVVEVPFMKWAHLAYRPLAIYLKAVKEQTRELEGAGRLRALPMATGISAGIGAPAVYSPRSARWRSSSVAPATFGGLAGGGPSGGAPSRRFQDESHANQR